MCPWPRLQGAIWDPEAFTVNYRDRGEQRTSAKKAAAPRSRGKAGRETASTAISASTVCPIGIDIREGPNFACINCGLCVDACDSVMSKLGCPRGLIDYESWNNIERGRRARAASFPAGASEDRRTDGGLPGVDGCDRLFLHGQDQRQPFGPA